MMVSKLYFEQFDLAAYVPLIQAPLSGANAPEAFTGSLVSPPAITVSCSAREMGWWPLLGTETAM